MQQLTGLGPGWRAELAAEPLAAERAWDAVTRAEIERRWAELRGANPRFHDGSLLVVTAIDEAAGVLRLARGTFKPMAVQDSGFDLGYFGLGVKGLIVGRDWAGEEHVLIARRGPGTRIYQLMWEVAPAGGVAVPDAGVSGDARGAGGAGWWPGCVLAALIEEGREELGIELAAGGLEVVAIVRDGVAHSCDVIVRAAWPGVVDPRASVCRATASDWEYVDAAWLARADAGGFDAEHAGALVGPARAVLRWLGWTAGGPGA